MTTTLTDRAPECGLFYTTHGAGPPLLVIHGGLGLDHTYLRPWLDPLGKHATLVYPDLRGCGRSPRPDDWETLDLTVWTADLDALREVLGYERWAVLGHSAGGFLALEYARRYPESVEAVALCAMAPSLGHVGAALAAVQERAAPEAFETLVDAFSVPRSNDRDFEETWRATAPFYFHRPTPERVSAACDGVAYSAGAFNRSIFGVGPAFDARPWLGVVTAPALVLGGRHDWIYPPEHGAEPIASGLPHAEVVVFEESGHYPFVEEPERFVRVVAGWLDALPDPRPGPARGASAGR